MSYNLTTSFISLSQQNISGDTLVCFALQKKSDSKKNKNEAILDHFNYGPITKILNPLAEDKSIQGKLGEIVSFRDKQALGFKNLIVVGLGLIENLTPETLRQQCASMLEALKTFNTKEASLIFSGFSTQEYRESLYLRALVEGFFLANYSFDKLKSKKTDPQKLHLQIVHEKNISSELTQAFKEAVIVSQCVNFSRYLGDMPGNLMTPSLLAEEAVKASKGTGIKVTVWNKTKIRQEKMGGLLGVSMGSSQDPRFIIMEYKKGPKKQKPLVFVGKGLTFDCGGISIKPSASMEEMKYDMCGGANVIGTLLAIARLQLPINAVGLIPATENLAGPAATKPGDVHTARNGKTFEVNNTDAEGRLILADALCYASELKPQAIIDVATLTGAMQVALGNIHTGYFTRSQDLKIQIEEAAKKSEELVWNMPLCDFHVKDMKGTFADLSNISSGKGAGSATAAAFLEQFVDDGIPWAHFDIAGTAWAVGGRFSYCPKKGASGVMIRTFVEICKNL